MYQYPFLLLTADDIRNSSIADMIEDEMTENTTIKNEFYTSLPSELPKKVLYDLLEIDNTMANIFVEIFRSNMNVLDSKMPDIDVWRVKDKLKRLLTILRRKCPDITHPFDDFLFSDKIRKIDLWEDNKAFNKETPSEWNAIFLNRISDIHRHMYRLVNILEPRVLVFNQVLSAPSNSTSSTSSSFSSYSESSSDVMNSIGKILETCRIMHREVKDYTRLIDSL